MALKVFVVEDNELMRRHLVELLSEDANIEWVGAAETEAEAKDWLERNPKGWDIAILDLFLREGTGAGVLRHCRNRSETQDVLLMTNYPISSLLSKRTANTP